MKKTLVIVLAIAMIITLCACGQPEPATPDAPEPEAAADSPAPAPEPIIIKYSTTFSATGVQADGAQKLKELVEEYSEGRMSVELYPASQLGSNVENMEGLRQGTIEMTELSCTAISAYSDIWSTFSLPYLWESGRQAYEAVSSDNVMEILEADLEANGMMLLAWQNVGARSIINTKRAIYTPADLNGIRVRVIEDPILVDSMNAMGASAVGMAWSECYSGLEQGTIDGVENMLSLLHTAGMTEVAKFCSLTEHFILPDPLLVSSVWFNSLSAENQEALVTACKEYERVWNDEIWPAADAVAQQAVEGDNVAVNEVDKDAFFEATQVVRDNFIANGSEGQAKLYAALMEAKDKLD